MVAKRPALPNITYAAMVALACSALMFAGAVYSVLPVILLLDNLCLTPFILPICQTLSITLCALMLTCFHACSPPWDALLAPVLVRHPRNTIEVSS